jgi:ornithine cyclodeaminase/alanine dehydrogenase-like protein (mu-crystallin family)
VGASTAKTRELDSETVARARFYVDSREAALAEAGDLLIPLGEGRFGPDHIAGELGAVLLGSRPGRSAKEDITIFESLGLAIEDAAAARVLANRAAAETGLGRLAMDQ